MFLLKLNYLQVKYWLSQLSAEVEERLIKDKEKVYMFVGSTKCFLLIP